MDKYPTARDLTRAAVANGLFDTNLAEAITEVVRTAAKIIHSSTEELSESTIERMLNLGVEVISRLDELIRERGRQP
jgi:hypothetical protein